MDFTENQKKTFDTQLGQGVSVERHDTQNSETKKAAERLKEIGELLRFTEYVDYKGSFACHIYESPALGQIFYVTQVGTLRGTNELTAAAAVSQLRKDVMTHYGRQPGEKRSGF